MKTNTLLLVAGIAGFTWFLFTRRSRPKPPGDQGTLKGIFKGMTEELQKPLDEIASNVPPPKK